MSKKQTEIFKSFINNKKFADVVFVVGTEKEQFYSHKFLISAVSNYWRNKFYEQGWEKKITRGIKKVLLPKINPNVFQAFLQYVYTREVEIKDTLVFQLLSLAKLYSIDELTRYCLNSFEKTLDQSNCISYYEYSQSVGLKKWSDIAFEYIKENTDKIFKTVTCLDGISKTTIKKIFNFKKIYALEIHILKSLIHWATELKRDKYLSNKDVTVQSLLKEFIPFIKIEMLNFEGLQILSDLELIDPNLIFDATIRLTRKFNLHAHTYSRSGIGLENIQVLLLAACRRGDNRINFIKQSIMSTGISNVTVQRVNESTPSYEEMLQYNAVVLRNRRAEILRNSDRLGDQLAKFVQTGRGLVVFAINTLIDSSSDRINGKIREEGYIPLKSAERIEKDQRELGEVLIPEHEIMVGVESFRTKDYTHVIGTHNINGGKIIANWTNGYPLITEKIKDEGCGPVVCLNFHPISTQITNDCGKAWLQETDGSKIIANSVSYVASYYLQKISLEKKKKLKKEKEENEKNQQLIQEEQNSMQETEISIDNDQIEIEIVSEMF
ncbi:btb/poz domain-containing [Anaeramoeba flamelloides]|uniref:Btb/poz domain-containing n=1 Tax=Anaeramoeba flamelloides TaxID=1746091 RepID=A0AAV8A8R8_9EUKA|nr:btb/poz domain-containing [Anaeramoeba flamelloides]